jgi:predicted 2-oxoglutarate/Fe(II)-dependent dioxygenase YbiX
LPGSTDQTHQNTLSGLIVRTGSCADHLGSLNLNIFQPGHQLGWHYDNADWVITLMLQPAESGGVYEYIPESRQPDDEKFEQVSKILDGTHTGVHQLNFDAGALILFRGRYTIHRVTPVRGWIPRLLAVFSYDTRPGVMLTEHNRLLFYGRVA